MVCYTLIELIHPHTKYQNSSPKDKKVTARTKFVKDGWNDYYRAQNNLREKCNALLINLIDNKPWGEM